MNGFIQVLIRIASSICVLAILFIGEFTPVNAQNIEHSSWTIAELLNYTEKFYGSDDVVTNGRAYLPDHYDAKGNPYFLFDNPTQCTLIINGKKYEKKEILYNIDSEKLILQTLVNNAKILLVLNNEFIDSFYLNGRHFINGTKYLPDNKFPGFIEQVYDGNFTLLTNHKKSFISEYKANTPNGFYSKTKSTNYILNNGELKRLPTKKSLFEYFSLYKKEIKNFMSKNRIRYKKADFKQLNTLFEYCDHISSN
ncbi:MAG: hypothetical protein B6D61_11300 [Bacteroidetes bacterium 4484_249]|nr:MAG: hypothetical protein B6D61_11300 [Bacteroidetes bacterium 4484_249]